MRRLNNDDLFEGIARNDPGISKVSVLGKKEVDLKRLVAALSHNTVVKNVKFHQRDEEHGGRLLGDLLRVNNTITKLVIKGLFMGDEGARLLAAGLESNSSLTHLNLDRNGLSDVGPIFGALKRNTSLRHLNLSSNTLRTGWGPVVRDAVRVNLTLTELDMHGAKIGDENAKVLAAGLEDNSSLTRLNLK